MGYKVAPEDLVEEALRRVLAERGTVHSQGTLRGLVVKELARKDAAYTVSLERLRRVASKARFATMEIHARRGDRPRPRTQCPVCGAPMERVKNRTLFGGEVTLQFSCTRCSYWTGRERRVPTRYVFNLRRSAFK